MFNLSNKIKFTLRIQVQFIYFLLKVFRIEKKAKDQIVYGVETIETFEQTTLADDVVMIGALSVQTCILRKLIVISHFYIP